MYSYLRISFRISYRDDGMISFREGAEALADDASPSTSTARGFGRFKLQIVNPAKCLGLDDVGACHTDELGGEW
jgi:hypothetical protein